MLRLLTLLLLTATATQAQLSGPPAGGPTGQFLGPPSGNAGNFLGVWEMTWDGPIDARCPCRGSLAISTNAAGELVGVWKSTGPAANLRGSIGFDQNVWIGTFAQSDEADFPMRGHFRLEYRDERSLTGSWHPDGAAIPFRWSGRRS
ncbi:MAG TPA: hypothetical protein VEC60_14580 [Reyranella sp.]|nr:hypothetical protein [Reyranella sp.]